MLRVVTEHVHGRESWQQILLRVAAGFCFVGHGLLAVRAATIYHSEWNVWIQSIAPATPLAFARVMLQIVGTIDIMTGLSFFVRPHLMAYAWALLWGFATAMSRLYFLSAPGAPFVQAVLHPAAEMLVRSVNFAVPLMCLVLDQRQPLQSLPRLARTVSKVSAATVASVAVLTLLSSRLLAAVAEFDQPHFYYELMKRGESAGAFFAMATLSALALVGFMSRYVSVRASTSKLLTAFIIYACIWPELYEVGLYFQSRGFVLSLIDLVEHLPVWAAAIYWLDPIVNQKMFINHQSSISASRFPKLNLLRPTIGSQHERHQDRSLDGASSGPVLCHAIRLQDRQVQ